MSRGGRGRGVGLVYQGWPLLKDQGNKGTRDLGNTGSKDQGIKGSRDQERGAGCEAGFGLTIKGGRRAATTSAWFGLALSRLSYSSHHRPASDN